MQSATMTGQDLTPKSQDRPCLLWVRDDLRVDDNPALVEAARSGRPVIALFVLDEVSPGLRALGGAQKWMLHHALHDLQISLDRLGAQLILRRGHSDTIVREVALQSDAAMVVWNRRHLPAGVAIDAALKRHFHEIGVDCRSRQGNLLHEPTQLTTGEGGPFKVYLPFWRAFERTGTPREPVPAPVALAGWRGDIASETLDGLALLPTKPDWAAGLRECWEGGETGATQRLQTFIDEGLHGYADGRDFPARPHVSRLSPDLRFGTLSPFRIWHAAANSQAPVRDIEKFHKELVWREFSAHLLFHFPTLPTRNFSSRFDDFPWRTDNAVLRAWQKGQTGYPIVDAGVRELWHTGYMHNRVRMVVASFLVKHLLIDWREGEAWFWDTLVDGDPANNAASWQWVAGSGADAAPYFRVFNPVLQGRKFDPDGTYVRRWIPEIAGLPDRFVHSPWEASSEILIKAGVRLGNHYPLPIVDHDMARRRALDAFEQLRKAG